MPQRLRTTEPGAAQYRDEAWHGPGKKKPYRFSVWSPDGASRLGTLIHQSDSSWDLWLPDESGAQYTFPTSREALNAAPALARGGRTASQGAAVKVSPPKAITTGTRRSPSNADRLPTLENAPVILKRGEVAHGVFAAQLLKEVAVREYRGGQAGFSFRLLRGMRYHVGGSRGQSVVVGSRIEVVDSGSLVVTSTRAVFVGTKRAIEFPYGKLIEVRAEADVILLAVSSRQASSVMSLGTGAAGAAGLIRRAAEGFQ